MLLGIQKVVPVAAMELGKFYLRYSYGDTPNLFQCVEITTDGGPQKRALFFDLAGDQPMFIEAAPDHGPVVELPEVHIRIDGASLSGTEFSSAIRPGTLVVVGESAFVAAMIGFRNFHTVNLMTGEIVFLPPNANWASFSTWQLVIEQAGEEIPIFNFGVTAEEE